MTDSIIYEIAYDYNGKNPTQILLSDKEKGIEKAKEILSTTSAEEVKLFEHKKSLLYTLSKKIEVIQND